LSTNLISHLSKEEQERKLDTPQSNILAYDRSRLHRDEIVEIAQVVKVHGYLARHARDGAVDA
jgi:hypothetical protein